MERKQEYSILRAFRLSPEKHEQLVKYIEEQESKGVNFSWLMRTAIQALIDKEKSRERTE